MLTARCLFACGLNVVQSERTRSVSRAPDRSGAAEWRQSSVRDEGCHPYAWRAPHARNAPVWSKKRHFFLSGRCDSADAAAVLAAFEDFGSRSTFAAADAALALVTSEFLRRAIFQALQVWTKLWITKVCSLYRYVCFDRWQCVVDRKLRPRLLLS